MSTMEKFKRYALLTEAEKVEARMSWLERKMVEVLWLLISLTSLVVGGVAAWLSSEFMETRSLWLLVPVFVVAWAVAAWLLQRTTFRGSPPHIDFIQ
jgi:cation transporter-like permease